MTASFPASFPATRLRRTRSAPWSRALHAENSLSPADLIWPLFVIEGSGVTEPVKTMPGVNRLSVDRLAAVAHEAVALGIPCVALFPFTQPDRRSEDGAEALNPDNLICRAIKALKDAEPGLGVLTDVALDPYTSHGHDGLLADDGRILNDATVEVLVGQSLNQTRAGCDVIAPSDMMDGRIAAIRAGLEGEGFDLVQIMAYSAKYASAFYGPFRDAVGSGGYLKGDKKTYQMDPANSREAIREVELDIAEGADSVMVKPGMPYLDIIRMVRDRFDVPVLAYQVSGEYALIEAAVAAGVLDRDRAVIEVLTGFKRAGCSGVLTYFAPLAARLLG